MARQLNFFLGAADLINVEALLRKSSNVRFVRRSAQGPLPVQVRSLVVDSYGSDDLSLAIVRASDLPHLCPVQLQGTSTFLVTSMYAAVVELDRCFVDATLIRSGRLYFSEKHLEKDGRWRENSPEFLKWAAELIQNTKRSLRKIDGTRYYAGEQAIEMRGRGILFEQIDLPAKHR